jgi:hypothetical protein
VSMILGPIFEIGSKLIDKLIATPEEKQKAQLELLKMQQSGELEQMKVQLSAILAEAKSDDPWTSRARPAFLYVMYILILTAIPFAVIWAFAPNAGNNMALGLQKWLAAIPEDMWWLMGAGYLGYTASRTIDKKNGK